MGRIIVVGTLGRAINFDEQEKVQIAPAATSDSTDRCATTLIQEKASNKLAAQFALSGHEMRVICKAGRSHFDVRRAGRSFTVSTIADLNGLLRQFEAVAA